jgi:hypothetical protein
MDYCKPEVCKYCGYECDKRSEERKINYEWNEKRFLGDPIYMIPHD